MTQCKRCLYDTDMKGVTLEEDGVCNYCKIHDKLENMYPQDEKILDKIIDEIKNKTKNNKYNCVIGISGGCDSSYMLWKLKQKGLNPLAVHWDNGWNTEYAENNISVMTKKLSVDLIRYNANDIYHELNKSFLYASVKDADIPNDIALLALVLYTAEKYKIKYNFSGHDFRTEGTCPPCWTFMDTRYLKDVYKKYTNKELHNFPTYTLLQQIIWGFKSIKTVRPLYYINKTKAQKKIELEKEFGWKDYGAMHCENIYTMFVGNYIYAKKFSIDMRRTELSARIRSKYITKEDALKILEQPIEIDDKYVEMIAKKYFKSKEEFLKVMCYKNKTFEDYGNYFKRFKSYKFLFWLGMKINIFPVTYYEKYTKDARWFK